MTITFDSVTQFQWKLHFWKGLINTFLLMYHLLGIMEVQSFPKNSPWPLNGKKAWLQ